MTTVNITVTNDADFYQTFQYATSGQPSVPIDITGASMVMMLRRNASDNTAALRLGTDTGEIVLSDPADGEFTVFIAQATLERLGIGDFEHSNVMTLNGYKISMWTGTFTNNPGAAR